MSVSVWCGACATHWDVCPTQAAHKEYRKFKTDFRLGGRRVRKLRDTREDAEDYEHVTITDYKRSLMFPNAQDAKRTFGEACEYYRTNYLIPNRQFQDEPFLDKIKAFFGPKTSLAKIDKERCKEYFAVLASTMQPASVVRRWTLLVSVFRENEKWLPTNPARGVIPKLFRKKADRPKTVYFTDEEYLQLLRHVDRVDDEDMIVIFRNTGFRAEDGRNLMVEHCDFTTNTIHLRDQKNQEVGTLPMVPEVRERILGIMRRKNITSGYLLNMKNHIRRFRRVVKKAGLYQPYPYNKTLHSLRHSWGTYVQKSYKDINVTQKLMRHNTIKMTMRYAHASNDSLKSAALSGSAPTSENVGHFQDTPKITPLNPSEKA